MSPLNDDWTRYKVPDCEPPSTAPPKPADSRAAVVPPNLDALLAENQRLREKGQRVLDSFETTGFEENSESLAALIALREALAGDAE